MNIKAKADSLSRKYSTRNPFEIIKEMNVILVFAPLIGVRGFFQYYKRNNIIYISDNLSKDEQYFVCAHELGHLILHKNMNTVFMDTRKQYTSDKYEIEADTFAMDLLVDDKLLSEYCGKTMEQLSEILGFSERLLELRLKN